MKRDTKKIYLRTFGCQMNFLDSEVVVGILAREGFELVDSPGKADVILFNGCSVRQHAEERVWGGLGALKKNKGQGRSSRGQARESINIFNFFSIQSVAKLAQYRQPLLLTHCSKISCKAFLFML